MRDLTPKLGRYYFSLISLVIRIIDNPSRVKANPKLKAGDATRFLSISNTPMRITITFKTMIPSKFDFIFQRTVPVDIIKLTAHSYPLFLEATQMHPKHVRALYPNVVRLRLCSYSTHIYIGGPLRLTRVEKLFFEQLLVKIQCKEHFQIAQSPIQ